jgi:hypothetical protein
MGEAGVGVPPARMTALRDELPSDGSRLVDALGWRPMGRGSRPTVRWKNDRRRKKKERDRRKATPPAPAPKR